LLQSINIDIFSVNTKILFFPKLLSAYLRITNAYIILVLHDLSSKRGVDFRSDWALCCYCRFAFAQKTPAALQGLGPTRCWRRYHRTWCF